MNYHVYPIQDIVEHELTDDCVCGPEFEDQENGCWLVVHHGLLYDE